MLRHLNEVEAANKIQRALETVYEEKKTLTRDVGGTSGTHAFADAVVAALEAA
jgi:isocitrate dehydrogenase (NAD+)